MAVTKIDAWMVTCAGTCNAPHGYHLVTRLSQRYGCNCPGFEHRKACRHIDEVAGSTRPTEVARLTQIAPCEAKGCEAVGTVPAGSPLLAWGYRCGAHRAEVAK